MPDVRSLDPPRFWIELNIPILLILRQLEVLLIALGELCLCHLPVDIGAVVAVLRLSSLEGSLEESFQSLLLPLVEGAGTAVRGEVRVLIAEGMTMSGVLL